MGQLDGGRGHRVGSAVTNEMSVLNHIQQTEQVSHTQLTSLKVRAFDTDSHGILKNYSKGFHLTFLVSVSGHSQTQMSASEPSLIQNNVLTQVVFFMYTTGQKCGHTWQ